MPDHREHIQCEEEEEEEEVSMVLIPQAVVHKRAVMIEALHALIAVVAVHRVFGPQVLAVDTNVVQVELLID